jgi:CDP-diacylglycerol pyrophosphatase
VEAVGLRELSRNALSRPDRSQSWACRSAVLIRVLLVATMLIGLSAVGIGWAGADPNALWTIVHDQCSPHEEQDGDPAPCALVDAQDGYALLKDLVGERQFLLIPTLQITGIESPILLDPGAKDYFADAWRARYLVEERAERSLPPDWVSLAINSMVARSQNQLHIHIDCLRADVHQSLAQHAGSIGPTWAPFAVPLAGAPYSAIEISDLNDINVFQLLAESLPGAREDMSRRTLVVVGSPGGSGFVVLAGQADAAAGDEGSGEDLQDHALCAAPAAGK